MRHFLLEVFLDLRCLCKQRLPEEGRLSSEGWLGLGKKLQEEGKLQEWGGRNSNSPCCIPGLGGQRERLDWASWF